jgi:putative tryptophan/tyrosine transport system ATP-binding protein
MSKVLIDIDNVSLSFPGGEKAVLSSINYQVQTGDFVVVLGSNGSGKSSLLKLLNRQYQPTAGKILLEGNALNLYTEKKLRRQIKMLTQNCHESLFISLTVLENYLLVKQFYEPDLFAVKSKLEREYFENYLLKFNPNLARKLDQLVEQLSGGEKQALALALMVLYPPRILLLDEHTSALDPVAASHLMRLTYQIARESSITCFLTTHDLAIAEEYGNRILALRHGVIHQKIERSDVEINQSMLLAGCY